MLHKARKTPIILYVAQSVSLLGLLTTSLNRAFPAGPVSREASSVGAEASVAVATGSGGVKPVAQPA
jgi:hypothetical protein